MVLVSCCFSLCSWRYIYIYTHTWCSSPWTILNSCYASTYIVMSRYILIIMNLDLSNKPTISNGRSTLYATNITSFLFIWFGHTHTYTITGCVCTCVCLPFIRCLKTKSTVDERSRVTSFRPIWQQN
jgi:hypothetical protein